ncbi:MAG: hypothetical protein H6622_00955 [Halobacteriovoraceae bacterium]|nr:hypothetical protein [Halobacteriovoraceae bacterium]
MKKILVLSTLLFSISLFAQNKKELRVGNPKQDTSENKKAEQNILDLNYFVPMNRLYFEIETKYLNQEYTIKNQNSENPKTEYKNPKLNIDGRFSFSPMPFLKTSIFMNLSLKNKKEISSATKSDGTVKTSGTVNNTNDEIYNGESINNWGLENFGIEVLYRLMRNTHGLFDLDLLLSFSPNLIDAQRGVQYEALSRFYSTDGNASRGSHEFVFGAQLYKHFGDLRVGSYIHTIFNSTTKISEIEGDSTSSDLTKRKDLEKEIESYLSIAFGFSGQFFFTPTVAAKLYMDFKGVPEQTTTYDLNSGATTMQYTNGETQESYFETKMGLEFSFLTTTDSKVTLGSGFNLLPDVGTTTSQKNIQSGAVSQLTATEKSNRNTWFLYLNGAITF